MGWGRRPLAAQGIGATSLPAGMPVADALAGDPQLAGDLGLAEAGGEQLSSAQPASLAAFTLLLCRSTAGSGWHALILPRPSHQLQLDRHAVRSTPKTL